jgi:hypothetical protein
MTAAPAAETAARPADAADGATSAPLREAPPWEKALRAALALLVVALCVLAVADFLDRPAKVHTNRFNPYAALLSEANAGRVERLDTDGPIRWRSAGGALYELDAIHPGVDVRELVELQPYVRDHPGAIRYGAIEPRRARDSVWLAGPIIVFSAFLLSRLIFGPRPRLASRWGWFWIAGTGAGVVPYLLLSGSWSRTAAPGAPPRRRRVVGGGVAFLAVVALNTAIAVTGDAVYDRLHPQPPLGAYTPAAPAAPA